MSVLVATLAGAIACKSDIPHGSRTCCDGVHTWDFCCSQNQGFGCHDGPTEQQCIDHGFGETGVDTASGSSDGSASMTLATGPDSAEGADSSGGECLPDNAVYACHGWVAGVHQHTNGNKGFAIGTDINAWCVGGQGYTILKEMPWQGDNADNDVGFELCKSECDTLVAGGMFDAGFWGVPPSGWTYLRTDCIFKPDGNNGTIPLGQLDAGMNGASALCDWVGTAGQAIDSVPVQNPYIEPAMGDHCEMTVVDCDDWSPQSASNITHNLVGTAHTVWIDDVFLASVHDSMAAPVFACDVGRFTETTTGFKFTDLQSNGELYYSLGFRSGDKTVRVKRNATTWISLDSWDHVGDALDLVYPYAGTITLDFKRGTTTHTMTITVS